MSMEDESTHTSRAKERDEHKYMSGFGNEFATEALKGALPHGQNTPQVCPYKLYAEQLSGTAFTMPRSTNLRTWLYRIRPGVCHTPFTPLGAVPCCLSNFSEVDPDPNQMRWKAMPPPSTGKADVSFVEGLFTVAGSGDASAKRGVAAHLYWCNCAMSGRKEAFVSSDGDMLIVPQMGVLELRTEMGRLTLSPMEICVIPCGIRFSVDASESSRGYVFELFKGHFTLPSLGPIGANGLANPRDFLYPTACYDTGDESLGQWTLITKFCGSFFTAHTPASPFDVVAWHGNYAPYKYDLERFCAVGSVSYDHLDPSIYTVLTCPSEIPGEAIADFVIFPPRWMCMEHSFRPPYFHRNVMSELMGMIHGSYDAKTGFEPGGVSLHPCMIAHGPDAETFEKASKADTSKPEKFEGGLAFMFETSAVLKVRAAIS
mmetsp:Transcript_10229/g.23950  ORF Transcript_10229/g.23950 Transcript_10229/m.23950 type:complete len:430 (+) Transcript_10229:67-1356(+)